MISEEQLESNVDKLRQPLKINIKMRKIILAAEKNLLLAWNK